MVVLDLVWATDPGISSTDGNGEEALVTGENSALARILKLPIIFESAHLKLPEMAQNGLKLCNLVKNGNFLPVKKCKLPVKMTGPS